MIEAYFIRNTQFGPPYAPTGYFVLNLLTNREAPLPRILDPMDSWPH
jgi:hypothetical protein